MHLKKKINIDYNLLSEEILTPSGETLNFLQEYGDFYNFWYDLLLEIINLDDLKLQQINFLKDLMNGFQVYKKIEKLKNKSNHKAEILYLKLLGNPNKTVDDIFLNRPTEQYNSKIYSQAKMLFHLRGKIFKNCLVTEL